MKGKSEIIEKEFTVEIKVKIKDNKVYIDNTPIKYWITNLHDAISCIPEGIICQHCGKINLFFDDLGWFAFIKAKDINKKHPKIYIGCEDCYNGKDGQAHNKKYGLGER